MAMNAIELTMEKTCRKCGVTKPLTSFSLSRRASSPTTSDVYRTDCKTCCAAAALQWQRDNAERARETRLVRDLAKSYGITVEDYDRMLRRQGGVCAICGRDEPNSHGRTGKKFRLAVDHCHATGKVRGLLCQKCNRAIGLIDDSPELLRNALTYLLDLGTNVEKE